MNGPKKAKHRQSPAGSCKHRNTTLTVSLYVLIVWYRSSQGCQEPPTATRAAGAKAQGSTLPLEALTATVRSPPAQAQPQGGLLGQDTRLMTPTRRHTARMAATRRRLGRATDRAHLAPPTTRSIPACHLAGILAWEGRLWEACSISRTGAWREHRGRSASPSPPMLRPHARRTCDVCIDTDDLRVENVCIGTQFRPRRWRRCPISLHMPVVSSL